MMDFQPFEMRGKRLLRRQHDRHDHECAQARVNAVSQFELRQRLAPKRLVMLLFTSAIAASMARTNPDAASTTSARSRLPVPSSSSSGHAIIMTASNAMPAM